MSRKVFDTFIELLFITDEQSPKTETRYLDLDTLSESIIRYDTVASGGTSCYNSQRIMTLQK